MPKTTKRTPVQKENVQEIKIDKEKVKYFLIAVIALIVFNLISSKKTYINENLEFITCRGLKFGDICIGSKEVTKQDINLPELPFN